MLDREGDKLPWERALGEGKEGNTREVFIGRGGVQMRAAMASKKNGKFGSPARKSGALMAFYLEKEV